MLTFDNDDTMANFFNSGNKMTITNIILTNQRRPYKSELQKIQQKLDKIDMSYHLRRCVIIIGGASEILVW